MKAISLLLSTLLCSSLTFAQKTKTVTYKVDPAHSSVVFGIDHMGFGNVYGMVHGLEGSFSHPEGKPEGLTMDLVAKTENIDTGVKKRDDHLKSPDFFNSKQYPELRFKSTKVEKLKGDTYKLTGDLSLHGQTKPITIQFDKFRTGKGPEGETRTGGEARFKLKRSDYGMNFMQGENMLGDEVEMIVSFEGIRQ